MAVSRPNIDAIACSDVFTCQTSSMRIFVPIHAVGAGDVAAPLGRFELLSISTCADGASDEVLVGSRSDVESCVC